jgi:hypothetical protein
VSDTHVTNRHGWSQVSQNADAVYRIRPAYCGVKYRNNGSKQQLAINVHTGKNLKKSNLLFMYVLAAPAY